MLYHKRLKEVQGNHSMSNAPVSPPALRARLRDKSPLLLQQGHSAARATSEGEKETRQLLLIKPS